MKTIIYQNSTIRQHMVKKAPPIAQPEKKGQLTTYGIIFVIGFLAGVAFTVYKGNVIMPATGTAADGRQAPPHNEEIHQAILKLEAEVTANPDNFQAWTNLGNLYYDTNQATKAIAAYNTSIKLHAADANLLTDLGVMYRQNKEPEKAIEAFNLAARENPSHLPSRYNKGIVMFYDLGDKEGAIASWEEMLKIDPQAKTNNNISVRELIDKVKADQGAAK